MAIETNKKYKKKDANGSIERASKEIGKLPPQALEVEKALLGALLTYKDAYSNVCELLAAESFYHKNHQYIYQAMSELSLAGQPIDILTVSEKLKVGNRLEAVGGFATLSELSEIGTSAVNIEEYAEIIYNKFLARDLIRISSNIEEQAFGEETDIKNLLEYAEGQIFEINQRRVKKEVTKVGDVVADVISRINNAAQQEGGYTGLRTGFTKLDEKTNGWQPATLNIIAARPAMGKTAFVLSMAKNMAIDYGYPVAIFSLEMSNLELVNRLVINASEIEGEKIKTGRLTPNEWQDLYAKTDCLNSAPIFIDDTANISVSELTTKARRLKSEHDIQCIIIDYLQLMNASGMSYGSREQEVSIISRSLKGLAKELDIPVIALSQLNRGVESREEKRPQLSDLRESGAIEQDADMVVFIHRPEYYKILQDAEGNSNEGVAEIIIAKHRSGAVGDVRLQFTKELIKFSNLTERRYGSYQADTSAYQEFGNKYNEPMPIQPSSVDPF